MSEKREISVGWSIASAIFILLMMGCFTGLFNSAWAGIPAGLFVGLYGCAPTKEGGPMSWEKK